MDHKLRTCSIAALALALALGLAASPSTNADTLRLRLKAGDALRYKSVTSTETDMMGQTSETVVTTTQVMKVLEQSDGWTKMRVTTEELEMSGDELPGVTDAMSAMKDVSYTFDVNENGLTRRIVLENADALDPMVRQTISGSMRGQNAVGFMGVHFPKGSIVVGSSWDVKIDADKLFETNEMITDVDGEIEVEFEVLGFESLDGKRHIKIKSVSEGEIAMALETPGGAFEAIVTMDAESTYWIDVADGTVTKMVSEGTLENDFGVGTMFQDTSTTVTRVK